MCEDSALVHSAFFCLSRPLFSTPFFFSQPFEHGGLGFVKSCGNSRVLNRWPSLSGALSGPLPQGAKPKRAFIMTLNGRTKTDPTDKRGPIYGALL